MSSSTLAPRTPSGRVLWLSTVAFTTLFAAWLMLGVLGLKIKGDSALMLGESAKALDAAQIKNAVESRFEWLLAAAILSGALLRLNFGIWADRFGGRNTMIALLLVSVGPTLCLAYADNYAELLLCAILLGLAGNSFSVGIAWNSAWFDAGNKGTALGIFGAGNVGAAGTKLLVILIPGLLTLVPAAGYWGGWIPGGWRIIPVLYAALMVLMALAIIALAPRSDRKPGQGRVLREMLAPLAHLRVWRFSLYYVVVFGAYVALSAWLPSYYVNVYQLDLRTASLLTALFIFPASLLRPLGGWLSDRFGPRIVTYAVFVIMIVANIPLCFPPSVMPLGTAGFTALMIVIGIGMGVGKASVYKYIPNYFPRDVGAVGGLVGMLGALGGFILPKLFGILGRQTGAPQAAFVALLVLTAFSLVWLHAAVMAQRASQTEPALGPLPALNAAGLGQAEA